MLPLYNSFYTYLLFYIQVYPKANHGACIVHLQRNVAAKFKVKALTPMISRAARAYKKSSFHDYLTEIELVSPGCAEYLRSIGFHHWTRSHCFGERYNIMTSNVAESLNAVLKEARELPIVSTIEYIRGILMTWFTKRRDKAANNKSPLTPKIGEIIQVKYEHSTAYEALKIKEKQYEVKTPLGESYHVDLTSKTCSCEEFDLLKIPCAHAICASLSVKLEVHTLVAPEYSDFYWRLAYHDSINPVPDMNNIYNVPDDIATRIILPPQTRRPPGRPKRTRHLSSGEFKVYMGCYINS